MKKIIKSKIDKNTWLSHALDLFAIKGEQGVKVEVLAKQLGVTKGGFYWHFKNRNDLLMQLLDYWVTEYTEIISKNMALNTLAPKQRLMSISQMVSEHNLTRYDLNFRSWAKQNAEVNKKLEQVTLARLHSIREPLRALGFEGDELEMRSRLYVDYESNASTMFAQDDAELTARMRQKRIDLICDPETQH
jgi:AcrR family transcriptional regulator